MVRAIAEERVWKTGARASAGTTTDAARPLSVTPMEMTVMPQTPMDRVKAAP